MKVAAVVLLALLLLLQSRLWVGNESMVAMWNLEAALEAQRLDNEGARQRNERLAAEVADLKSGLEAVEERARYELGMVEQGETFYQFVD